MQDADLKDALERLLSRTGIACAAMRIAPVSAGGNNRVHRIDAGGKTLLAKQYFRHPSDGRDRLDAEYRFLQHARTCGIRCVPAPIARDDAVDLGLYEFVEGRKLECAEIETRHARQAMNFLRQLNSRDSRLAASALSPASEARFSVGEQLDVVDERVRRLAAIQGETAVDAEAVRFTRTLGERWNAVRETVITRCATLRIDPRQPLEDADRCLSPSDFGFHNALLTAEGGIVFLDFEYAGWDDPAKTISDFFCQPAIPVSREYFQDFTNAALAYTERRDALTLRTRLLFPVFQMKWCCIVLNDFLPDSFARRRFADARLDAGQRKTVQLDKARRMLNGISPEMDHGLY